MIKAPIPDDESARLQFLHEYGILDTPEEEDFNAIVHLASDICKVPISLITFIDANRQWFKASKGVKMTATPRDISFCGHSMLNGEIFIVPDTACDERFQDNPLVKGEPGIRFYAGVPLVSPGGGRLGTLCVIDRVPNQLGNQQQEALILLGRQVIKLMELRRKDRQLQELSNLDQVRREELEKASHRQKKIVSILAHDIRSPLNSLKSFFQLLPDKKIALSQNLFWDMAGSQLNATLLVLDNIVEWGRLELRGEPEYRECRLQDIVKQTLAEQEIQAGLKGLQLKHQVDGKIKFATDENRLRFILRNLLSNAIKFTRTGFIEVDAALSQNKVLISVEDSGIGISPALQDQLFQGPRLGLSLVKEFVEKMNGVVTVESELGKGTVIALTLPRFP